jgi:hypothetical protein
MLLAISSSRDLFRHHCTLHKSQSAKITGDLLSIAAPEAYTVDYGVDLPTGQAVLPPASAVPNL